MNATGPPVYRPPLWVKTWFVVSTLLVAWDTGYVLLRPRSMKGGDLSALWAPYELYGLVDKVYGPDAWASGYGFTSAQALMNIPESILNILFLVLSARESPVAILVGFLAVVMTSWKTVLYWLIDQQSGWSYTGHNSLRDWIILFAIPNGAWIVVPSILAVVFGMQIARSLRVGAKAKTL
ncbi:uncharacterized protein JCM10292_006100 [Rhodotorula paludigena]|uniref:uncharacterized protein n=1 Tax=Rhodotorula paludigena TaxID=86838 RepID=UPI00316C2369